MLNKKVLINAFSSSGQVIISGIVFFVLYRFLLSQLGAEQLGIWSLVLATTSIANLANFGITSGLVKFVAEYDAKAKTGNVHKLVFTAFVTIFCFFLVLIGLIYFLAEFIMSKIIAPQHLATALNILPFSLGCLFINAIGGVYTSVLEGYQKNYQRNIIYTIGTILLLVISYILVPKFKLIGVAYAQMGQSIFIFITAFIFSKKLYPSYSSVFKWHWDKVIFKQLLSYGSKFQGMSICQMFYEPVTKGLLSKYGGLQMVAYYEMANKLVSQFRNLIVSANQVIIPLVAQSSQNSIKNIYLKSMSAIMVVNLPVTCALIFFGPFISIYWLGFYNDDFIFFINLISIATFTHIFLGPTYFGLLGEGVLTRLMSIHFLMAILNLALGYLFGVLFKGGGVIFGWCFSLIIGSLLLIFYYQKRHQIKINDLFSLNDLYILIFSILFILCAVFITRGNHPTKAIQPLLYSVAIFSIYLIFNMIFNKKIKLLLKQLNFSK